MKVSHFVSVAMIAVAILALAACAPAAAPTPQPPTAAPVQPTTAPTTAPTAAPTAAATTASAGKSAVVNVASNAALGKFLVDGDGMTLYMYPRDVREPSTSSCYDECAKQWPALISDAKPNLKSSEIKDSLFGTTTRKDGTKQVTFNGWPLYYFFNDKKAGDTLGQGVGDIWWVMKPDGGITTGPTTVRITVALGAGRDGDQSGNATLTARGNQTQISLDIKPGEKGAAQPVHVHDGSCPAPGAVKYPLTNIVDGKSTTTIDVKLADLLTGGFAINAHLSAADIGKYVACGNIPQGTVLTLDKGRDEDQHGTAVLISQGAKTQVNVFIMPLPGVAQPAHIHEGTCPAPGAVKYPLTNLAEGKSSTVVDVSLADLQKGGYAINAHHSTTDSGKYVACGNIKGAVSQ